MYIKNVKKIMITIIIIIIIIIMIIMVVKTKYIYCNLSQWLTFTENCLLEARYKKKKKNCLSVLISKINDHHLKIKI